MGAGAAIISAAVRHPGRKGDRAAGDTRLDPAGGIAGHRESETIAAPLDGAGPGAGAHVLAPDDQSELRRVAALGDAELVRPAARAALVEADEARAGSRHDGSGSRHGSGLSLAGRRCRTIALIRGPAAGD